MEIPVNWHLSQKQTEAFNYLLDKESTEVLYGGGAGGGKSYLGCSWIIFSCGTYPGSRWLIGRAILKTLKESTLLTFFKVCKDWGLVKGRHYNYNSIEGVIKFANGSEVYLKDLFLYPSDPEFDELGSTEYTGAFIDEASQITQKSYLIVMSRIRYKLDDFGLIPKMLTATNPTKNFLYSEFYKASKEGTLPVHRKFVPALVQDNPYISRHYIDNLHKLDRVSQERLLFGNWEYDDDMTKLFDYDAILNMFRIEMNRTIRPIRYITCDVARFGDDNTVIVIWNNLYIEQIFVSHHSSLKDTRMFIERIAIENGVDTDHIIVDEDGIGGGIVDEMGIQGFVNGSKAIELNNQPNNYRNLKAQCYFYLAEYINNGKIGCCEVPVETKEMIVEDLEQMKRHKPDADGKLEVTPKDTIKQNIGRSPDFGDAIMMRMFFELRQEYTPTIA